MIKLFQNKNQHSYQIELVSIHIPKTAGTSFRHQLESHYGKNGVQSFYGKGRKTDVFMLSSKAKVLHGHITKEHYLNLCAKYPFLADLPVITWIRQPVDRVISNYYYLLKVLAEKLDMTIHENGSLRNRMIKDLIEFACLTESRNVISNYIDVGWIDNKKLIFLGQQEHYDGDLKILCNKLGWEAYNPERVNVTGKKNNVTREVITKLELLNSQDLELHDKLLKFKNSINKAS